MLLGGSPAGCVGEVWWGEGPREPPMGATWPPMGPMGPSPRGLGVEGVAGLVVGPLGPLGPKPRLGKRERCC